MARELAYHSELAAKLYQSAIRYARHDREGKAAECLEQAVEHENKADQIRELMSRRCTAKLVGLRDGKQWGKNSDDVERLHVTVHPGGDFVIYRPVMRGRSAGSPPNHPASADPLGLSPLTNCTATQQSDNIVPFDRARRGSGGMTRKNARDARSSVSWMERKYGRRRLAFVTETLPCRSLRHLALVAAEADRVLDIAVKRLHRLLQNKGLPTDYVAVWELQERGALHLHLLCVGRHPWGGWAISIEEWDEIWRDAVSAVLGDEAEGMSWQSCGRVEQPRCSVARELSKYLSKGSKPQLQKLQTVLKYQLSNAGIDFVDLLPRSWVSISKNLKKVISDERQLATEEVEKAKLDWYELENLIRKSGMCVSKPAAAGGGALTRVIKTEQGFPVALSGRLVTPDIQILLDALSCLGSTQGGGLSKIA